MLDYLTRLQWSVFGSLNMVLSTILIASVYATGHFLGGNGQRVLWDLGGLALGVEYVMIVYRYRVLYRTRIA